MKNAARHQTSRASGGSRSFLQENSNPEEHAGANGRHDQLASPPTREILAEDLFWRILRWERRRAERYQKSFMLMLLEANESLQTNGGGSILTAIREAVSQSTRETDMVGWYREGTALGVLFTEISQQEKSFLEKLMQIGILESLRAKLGDARANQIHISFHFFPESWDEPSRNPGVDAKLYPDLLKCDEGKKVPRFLKRAIDIAGAFLAIVALAPLFFLIAVAIKLTSKGPVMFRQERLGQYGRRFTFLKFRSMRCANDARIHRDYVRRFIAGQIGSETTGTDQRSLFKIKDDPRVTRVGKFLRKTSLDELPQFINVLRGEMSLVGPRPPISYELESYKPWHRRRLLEVKPGITGLWQVYGRSRTTFDEMVRLDLRYADMWSLWLDVRILLQTPRAVLTGEGAL